MAEDFIEEIYKDAWIYTRAKMVVEMARRNDRSRTWKQLNQIQGEMASLLERYTGINLEESILFGKHLRLLDHFRDNLIDLADFMEECLLPDMERYLRGIGGIDVDDEEGYCLRSSSRGYLTIWDNQQNVYYHSKVDPMWEARQQVKLFYDPSLSAYAILGCGLGYHAYQLYCISNGSIPIYVFEQDEKLVDYAFHYGVLSWIPDSCLHVTVDEDIMAFLNCAVKENTGHYVFAPELSKLSPDVYPIIRNVYIQQNTRISHELDEKINFYRNTTCLSGKRIDELDRSNIKKQCIVIAAGPSLDDKMDFLRNQKGKMTLIAVGTVFPKLIYAGIKPDFVTVLDPLINTMKQLEGMEQEKVPLLLSTTAYWGWSANYCGPKYLVTTSGFLPEVEKYSKEYGTKIWGVDGTVTSMAVRAAIEFGAEEIYLVGADFSYPGGNSHCKGTAGFRNTESDQAMLVDSVDGGKVRTSAVLNGYREGLEGMISECQQIKFINLSPNGARIKGTLNSMEKMES